MTRKLLVRSAAGAMVVAALGFAPMGGAYTQTEPPGPDLKRGAVIVTQGNGRGALACAQCHASNGAADGSGAFPRLAEQSSYYLSAQMRAFVSGDRVNVVMSPIAQALSADEIAEVSAYYARVNAPFPPLPAADAALVQRGRELANVGSAAKGLPACDNCHGPGGAGEPPAIPYLAGQYGGYIASELHMWQSGLRKSSPEAMGQIAKRLDDQDIAAVAAYYQQVGRRADAGAGASH
jgi:cytochrome c553